MNEADVTGWTPAILKQYVDQRFLDSDKAVSAALLAQQAAVAKAEVATDKRFDALTDDADRRAHDLSEQISALQTGQHQGEGSSSTSQLLWARLLPVFLSALSIGTILYVALHK
jgi:hypothetical protein